MQTHPRPQGGRSNFQFMCYPVTVVRVINHWAPDIAQGFVGPNISSQGYRRAQGQGDYPREGLSKRWGSISQTNECS